MSRRLTLFYHISLCVCVHVCSCNLSVHAFIPPLRVSCGFLFSLCVSFVGLYVLVPRPDSAEGFSSCPSTGSRNGEKDWENDSTTSSTPSNAEYTGIRHGCTVLRTLTFTKLHEIAVSCLCFLPTGPKLYKEPSAKSNKHIIQNALAHCCLAGKVNEGQKNKILDVCFAIMCLCLSTSNFIPH